MWYDHVTVSETKSQTDKQTNRQTDKQTNRQTGKHKQVHTSFSRSKKSKKRSNLLVGDDYQRTLCLLSPFESPYRFGLGSTLVCLTA